MYTPGTNFVFGGTRQKILHNGKVLPDRYGNGKNLNISYANQIYEVSRKDCGKLVLGVIFDGSLFSNPDLTRGVKKLLNKLNLSDYHG